MIGVFGGTFNPVHWGHVRTALELYKVLMMDTMLMIPSGIPPHREEPDVDTGLRLAMLRAAIADHPELIIDERELKRSGPSYMIDTLQSLRQEQPHASIALCVGVDAFVYLHTWHRWRELFDYAHIVVAHRPGWPVDNLMQQAPAELREVIERRLVTDVQQLKAKSAGLLLAQKVTDIDISSSDIRQRIAHGESVAGLVPEGVLRIIEQNHLYQ